MAGQAEPLSMDLSGNLRTSSGGGGGGLSLSTTTTAAPVYVNGTNNALSTDTAGNLRVIFTGGITGTDNITQFGGNNVVTGTGVSGLGIPRFTVSNDSVIASITAPVAVTGTFFQATQPVSIAASVPVTGTFFQATQPVSGTFFQATQPVSAAALPLPTGASTEATLAKLPIAQGTALGANSGPMVQGSVTTAAPVYTTGQISPLSVDTAGNLRVTNTSSLVAGAAVIGSVTQSGTWNITNVSGTVSLPTGASTSALQTTGNTSLSSIDGKTPSLGQALAAASVPVVLTAAQITTLTPLATVAATQSGNWTSRVVGNAGAVLDFAGQNAASPANSVLIGGQFNTAPTTITTGNSSPLQLTSAGALIVSATIAANSSVNITQVAGAAISQGHGTAATAIRVELPTDGTGVVGLNTGANIIGKVGIDQTTPGTTNLVATNHIQINGSAVVTSAAGVQKVGIVGNAGATLDVATSSTTGTAVPTNTLLIGGTFTTATPTITTGNMSPLQLDASGNLKVIVNAAGTQTSTNIAQFGGFATNIGAGASGTGTPRVAVANDSTIKIWDGTNTGAVKAASTAAVAADPAQVVVLSPNNNTLANALFTKVSDGTNTAAVKAASTTAAATDPALVVQISQNSPGGGIFNTTQPTLANLGLSQAQLTTRAALIVSPGVEGFPVTINAGAALIGKVGIDQTTVGTTNAISIAQIGATTVVNGGLAGTLAIGGTQAQNAAPTANPIIDAGIARTTTLPTAVTQGNVSQLQTDKFGRLVTTGIPRELIKQATVALPNSTTETTLIAAVAATFNDILCITVGNGGTNTRIDIRDTTGGTVRLSGWVGSQVMFLSDAKMAFPQTAVNTNWTFQLSVAPGAAAGFITVYYLATT